MEQNTKEEYIKAKIDIIEFDNEDVITTSGITDENGNLTLPEIKF